MAGDTEKITVNLAPVDLGKMDLLVGQGLYSTRADFIRTAVRRLLHEQQDVVTSAIARNQYVLGVVHYSRGVLEQHRKRGERIRTKVVGVLHLATDISPDLADAVFESLDIRGVVRASNEVKERLLPKITRGSIG